MVWKIYANLVLDMTKYLGTRTARVNKDHVRQDMNAHADDGEFMGVYMAHEIDEPIRDAFPNEWGTLLGGGTL